MSSSKPLSVALVGAGMISKFHLTAWRQLDDRALVVAICDPNLDHAIARAKEFDVAETYPSVDTMLAKRDVAALDIASPRSTHAMIVDLAASRGIDALCQKPLTPTLSEAAALVRRSRGRMRLMAHENWRFRPWYRELKAWIASGDIGEIRTLQMTVASSGLLPDNAGRRPALERQPFMATEHRLIIAEDLIHHLDLLRWLCGPMRVVAARTAYTEDNIVGETLAAIFLETSAGAPVLLSGSLVAPGLPPRGQDRLELVGQKASVVFSDGHLRMFGPKPKTVSFDSTSGYQASFNAVISHFVDCLLSGAPFETDAADNLETLRLVEHAYLAAGLPARGERRDRFRNL